MSGKITEIKYLTNTCKIQIKFKSAADFAAEYPSLTEVQLKNKKINYIKEICSESTGLVSQLVFEQATPLYHELMSKLVDLVGNSIDAGADQLSIRLTSSIDGMSTLEDFAANTHLVEVFDNGAGFDLEELNQAPVKKKYSTIETDYDREFISKLSGKSIEQTGGQRQGLISIKSHLDAYVGREGDTLIKVGNSFESNKRIGALVAFWSKSKAGRVSISRAEYVSKIVSSDRGKGAGSGYVSLTEDEVGKIIVCPPANSPASSTTLSDPWSETDSLGTSTPFNNASKEAETSLSKSLGLGLKLDILN